VEWNSVRADNQGSEGITPNLTLTLDPDPNLTPNPILKTP